MGCDDDVSGPLCRPGRVLLYACLHNPIPARDKDNQRLLIFTERRRIRLPAGSWRSERNRGNLR